MSFLCDASSCCHDEIPSKSAPRLVYTDSSRNGVAPCVCVSTQQGLLDIETYVVSAFLLSVFEVGLTYPALGRISYKCPTTRRLHLNCARHHDMYRAMRADSHIGSSLYLICIVYHEVM